MEARQSLVHKSNANLQDTEEESDSSDEEESQHFLFNRAPREPNNGQPEYLEDNALQIQNHDPPIIEHVELNPQNINANNRDLQNNNLQAPGAEINAERRYPDRLRGAPHRLIDFHVGQLQTNLNSIDIYNNQDGCQVLYKNKDDSKTENETHILDKQKYNHSTLRQELANYSKVTKSPRDINKFSFI